MADHQLSSPKDRHLHGKRSNGETPFRCTQTKHSRQSALPSHNRLIRSGRQQEAESDLMKTPFHGNRQTQQDPPPTLSQAADPDADSKSRKKAVLTDAEVLELIRLPATVSRKTLGIVQRRLPYWQQLEAQYKAKGEWLQPYSFRDTLIAAAMGHTVEVHHRSYRTSEWRSVRTAFAEAR